MRILRLSLLCLALVLVVNPIDDLTPGVRCDQVRIGAIFDDVQDYKNELAFRYAIERVNRDPYILVGRQLVPVVVRVPAGNSFMAEKEACAMLKRGVAAIFGPMFDGSADMIKSITDYVEVPFIDTRWRYERYRAYLGDTSSEYSINIHPEMATLGQGFVELLLKYEYYNVVILYEDNESILGLQAVLDLTSRIAETKPFRIMVKKLENKPTYGYREVLYEVYTSESFNIVLACSKDIIGEVLKQAQQIGIITAEYTFVLLTLDAHTIDLSDFMYAGTNFTTYRLIDTNRQEVQSVVQSIVKAEMNKGRVFDFKDGNLDTNTALVYDAVHLFALALHQVSQIQDVSVTSADCQSGKGWNHGSSLINYMKLVQFDGLSGRVLFDSQGFRSQFQLQVMELQYTGLEAVGTWTPEESLNLTRLIEDTDTTNAVNIMANKTFVVSLLLNVPYAMLKQEIKPMQGNDRFEGFAIDLFDGIAKILEFNITYKVVDDANHGSVDEYGNWNGLIGEVLKGADYGGADFAIADLSVTSDRAKAVSFSMPWMNLGISIIYIKSRAAPPSLLSFLDPFTVNVWLMTAFGYVIVSIVMWVLARFTPYEWDNPYPCIEEPTELENQFSLANSFWFTIGSLLQQGSDVAPVALCTRLLAGIWYFFALIMISSYTANLAAFLTFEPLDTPLTKVDDLVGQSKIKYGVMKGGSTMRFFRDSNIEPFPALWEFMDKNSDEIMVRSNDEGIKKVSDEDGGYAFFMESASIEYITQRRCELSKIGGQLDSKGYGIPMAPGSPYKKYIDGAILKMQESGETFKLKNKWWNQKRGGGACAGVSSDGGAKTLGLPNVAGVFIVTVVGCIGATLFAICEFLIGTRTQSQSNGSDWWTEIKEELKFVCKCHGNAKEVRSGSVGGEDQDGTNRSIATTNSRSNSASSSIMSFGARSHLGSYNFQGSRRPSHRYCHPPHNHSISRHVGSTYRRRNSHISAVSVKSSNATNTICENSH